MSPITGLFDRRVRGFRIVEILCLLVLTGLIFWVYLNKAEAGHERREIGEVRQQIQDEQRAVKQLRAETAHLETYRRIETLSRSYLGMAPVKPQREATPEELASLSHKKGSNE